MCMLHHKTDSAPLTNLKLMGHWGDLRLFEEGIGPNRTQSGHPTMAPMAPKKTQQNHVSVCHW